MNNIYFINNTSNITYIFNSILLLVIFSTIIISIYKKKTIWYFLSLILISIYYCLQVTEYFDNTNLFKLYSFWTGTNQESEARKNCFNTLKNSELDVILITKNNLNDYIKEPLHEGFQYLSETHKADYLRTYFMHFYGGGYSDIKKTSESWLSSVKILEENPSIWAVGYKEVGPGGIPDIPNNSLLTQEMKNNWEIMIGNCAYIFKKNTPLTLEWYSTMMKVMDNKLENLKKYPGRTPTEIYTAEYPYPLEWSELLANIFHPIIYKYRNHIVNSLPAPDFNNYR